MFYLPSLTTTNRRNTMYTIVITAEAPIQFFIADIVGMQKENVKYAIPVITI